MDLLFIAVVLILALLAMRFSDRSGLPSLLLFLVLGLLSNAFIDFQNYQAADKFATVALIVIMFYGGFGTNWKSGKSVAKPAVVLSSLGVVATALLTGVFAHYVLKFPWIESFLLGSVVGSTDYASVSNILDSKNLNLKYNTGSLLELESGSNDPAAFTMTVIFLSIMKNVDLSIPVLVIKQVVFGIAIGLIMAFVVTKILENTNVQKEGLAIVFMTAMALFTYALTDVIGGNGYLAVYLFGIIIGNKQFIGKKDIVFFFDGFTELMSIGLFFLLGMLADPNRVLSNLGIALAVMLFMTIVARPLAVYLLTLPFGLKTNQVLVISFAGLRGAAAIAFAIMALNSGANIGIDLYHIVFGICVLSSFIQGSLLTTVAKKLNMVDLNDPKLTTYNARSDKGDISFIQTKVEADSALVGRKVKDLDLIFDFIVAKIDRDGETVVPRGNVKIQAGDVIVIGGQEYFDQYGQDLLEFTVTENHPWSHERLMDLDLDEDILVLAIERDNEMITAVGNTKILPGDRVLTLSDAHFSINYGDEYDESNKDLENPEEEKVQASEN